MFDYQGNVKKRLSFNLPFKFFFNFFSAPALRLSPTLLRLRFCNAAPSHQFYIAIGQQQNGHSPVTICQLLSRIIVQKEAAFDAETVQAPDNIDPGFIIIQILKQ